MAVRTAKPRVKPYKLSDERGLLLIVTPSKGKWWRLRYRFNGTERMLSLGTYPDTPLKAARERRDEARKLLANGINPSAARASAKAAKTASAANNFEAVAREWCTKFAPSWAASREDWILASLERHVFPQLGARPISEITAPELLSVLRKLEARGTLETAHRIRSRCGQIFRYAIATARAERDPTADLRGALTPVKVKHLAAITEPAKVGELLRMLDGYQGSAIVRCALRLAPLVFVRPGELRHALWADIDLDAAEWRYMVSKTATPHIVPLSTQSLAIIRELQPITGDGKFLFPSARTITRPMSDNAVLAALRRLDIPQDQMTGHGFRAMARTILDEVLGFPPHLIEHQLAHAVKDPLGRAYNRTQHLPERRKMMQQWADYLDNLRSDADVVQLRPHAA